MDAGSRRRLLLAIAAAAVLAALWFAWPDGVRENASSPSPVPVPAAPPAPPASPVSKAPTPSPAETPAARSPIPPPAPAMLRAVTGSVLGSVDRNPIEGARVSTVVGWIHRDADEPTRVAVTGADGRFSFDGLPRASSITLEASADGWTSESVRIPDGEGPAGEAPPSAEILLRPAAELRGTVTRVDGTPAAGVPVWVVDQDLAFILRLVRDMEDSPELIREPRCRTDAQGRYAVPGLAAGASYAVAALSANDGRSPTVTKLLLPDEPGGTTVDLVLGARTALQVRVLGPDDGPAGGHLGAHLLSEDGSTRVAAVEDGLATFENIDGGSYTVIVESELYAEADERVEVPDGRVAEITLRLEPGVAIRGSVVDATGAGVPGARLTASASSALPSLDETGAATTDDRGRFEIAGLRAGRHNLRMEQGPGDWRWLGEFEAPRQGLEILAGGALSFRLVPPEGRQLPEEEKAISILVREAGEDSWDEIFESGRAFRSENTELDLATGAGRMRLVPPGELAIVFRVKGFAPARRTVRVPSGGAADLGSIALQPGLALRGVAVDEEGRPVHDLRLMVDYGGFERSAVAATERDGSFRIPDLEPGAGTLKTWGPFSGEGEYPSADLRVVVAPGMEPLRVVVDRGVAVRLRVLRADGSAARRAVVDGRRAGMPTGEAESLGLTSDDGTLECRLVPGAWEFSAKRLDSVWGNPVGTDAEATAEVRRGESPVVELRFAE